MNNENNNITEASVLAWLRRTAEESGIKGLVLEVSTRDYSSGNFIAFIGRSAYLGHSLSEAIEQAREASKPSPDKIAKLRTDALRLENEAALLELELLNSQTATLNLSSNK